jgi:hypothetical protein
MAQKNQLAVPGEALRDPKSFEVLRVWIADNNQHVSLRAGVWEDPAAWGLMLADLARHIVNTYEPATASDREQILNRIKRGFDAELQTPTDTPTVGSVGVKPRVD